MSRKIVGNTWDRDSRNVINDNFEELYNGVDNISGKITDEIYAEIRNDVKLNWKEPVNTFADLPSDAETGDTRMVRETVDGVSKVYRYGGSDWSEIQQIDSTAITEVDTRLQAEIDLKETPQGAQTKANVAEANAIQAVTSLETKIYGDADKVVKVVESGSNANGEYIRYSDGMQYCWGEPFSQSTSLAAGGVYRSDLREWTYPKPFAKGPISVTVQALSYVRWADIAGRPGVTSVPVYQYGYTESTSAYVTTISAMGRWK